VSGWVSGSTKRATRLGQLAAQTPPVDPETMKSAFVLAMEGLEDGDADHLTTDRSGGHGANPGLLILVHHGFRSRNAGVG